LHSGVYITRLSKFLPNNPISNDEIEDYLGKINNVSSKAKNIVLKQNGIKTRYYAIDKNGNIKYTNSELTANAIKLLTDNNFKIEDIELLCCSTSFPDQIIPSHASMVHGELNGKAIEIISPSGVCCSSMSALKYGYLSVLSGNSRNAVCTGSELISPLLRSDFYNGEIEEKESNKIKPLIGFEKDFLRWMLSDGAGAALLENKPSDKQHLKIEWIDLISCANELDVCMYAGAEKENNKLKSWKEYNQNQWLDLSIFAIKQDVKILDKFIDSVGAKKLASILEKRKFDISQVDYILPHLSSEYFRHRFKNEMEKNGLNIPEEKWFTNLSYVGNVGSASIYLMLEEIFNSGKLIKGQKLLLLVPESARFTYAVSLLTVC